MAADFRPGKEVGKSEPIRTRRDVNYFLLIQGCEVRSTTPKKPQPPFPRFPGLCPPPLEGLSHRCSAVPPPSRKRPLFQREGQCAADGGESRGRAAGFWRLPYVVAAPLPTPSRDARRPRHCCQDNRRIPPSRAATRAKNRRGQTPPAAALAACPAPHPPPRHPPPRQNSHRHREGTTERSINSKRCSS